MWWGICLVVASMMLGCGSDTSGDNRSGVLRQDGNPGVFVSPMQLQNKGFRFANGAVFHDALASQVTTLTIGNFNMTTAAPFTLVSGGFRAKGLLTLIVVSSQDRFIVSALSVEESTFPVVEGTAQGPQVGDRIEVEFSADNKDSLTAENGLTVQRDANIIATDAVCVNTTRTDNEEVVDVTIGGNTFSALDLGSVLPITDGCHTVNGNISGNEFNLPNGFLPENFTASLLPEDQVLQISFTGPPAPGPNPEDPFGTLFDIFIHREVSQGGDRITTCPGLFSSSSSSLITCSTVQLAQDGLIAIVVQSVFDVMDNASIGTGDYTAEIVSVPVDRTGCGAPVQEVEPNGDATDPNVTGQPLDLPQMGGCVVIEGTISGTDADGVGNIDITAGDTIDADVFDIPLGIENRTFAVFPTLVNSTPNLQFIIRLLDANNNVLFTCSDVGTCAVTFPAPTARVAILPELKDPNLSVAGFSGSADYRIEIILANVGLSPLPPTTPPEPPQGGPFGPSVDSR
jgi:hypothetical protein